MRYERFIEDVKGLEFIADDATADSAVKAVLGILASSIEESRARKLTESLPDPLTFDKLRGRQRRIIMTPPDVYVTEIADQFNISREQAHRLIERVLETAKEAVGGLLDEYELLRAS
ncbi:MAG: DUF2267 domain-containing protein [Dehalococcoidia bacterium]|nr:DUF2267 domain-containing protein [Dehalococcoidia bacterium]